MGILDFSAQLLCSTMTSFDYRREAGSDSSIGEHERQSSGYDRLHRSPSVRLNSAQDRQLNATESIGTEDQEGTVCESMC